MISSNPRSKHSDRLYYDRYQYCFRVVLPHIEAIGQRLDHQHINKIVTLRDNLDYYTRKVNFGGTWKEKVDSITQEDIDNLHRLCDFFIKHKGNIKLQFLRNKCFIYTNDVELSEQLDHLHIFKEIVISKVEVARPRNTVKSRYPGYDLRIYFKPVKITEKERYNLIHFIDNNDHAIKLNVGMERFYGGSQSRGRYLTLRDYYFIDLMDRRLASMLELTCPGVIRKTMDIIYDDK